ncbi:MAG: hypothetical protein FJY88_01060 [Candidatus Eisenbacteria bacterium]|nr:hypothetical protein [Candidatus Eisenbacteria bacterium]
MQESARLVPILEAHLRDCPDDLTALDELEGICAGLGMGSSYARECHLRHLARSLGHEGVDAALAALRSALDSPGHDAILHIHLAQILALQDRPCEAGEELLLGTKWRAIESPRFLLHLIPGSTADHEREEIAAALEAGLAELEELFDLRWERSRPIVYFLYESSLHKKLATGDPMPAHAHSRQAEVHAVHGRYLRVGALHESCHILLGSLGDPPMLMQEGAAEYAALREQAHSTYLRARSRGGELHLGRLLDDPRFTEADPWLSYPMAGSFAGFLIRDRGVASFKDLYGSSKGDPRGAVRRVYGCSVDSLEARWRRFLAAAEADGSAGA